MGAREETEKRLQISQQITSAVRFLLHGAYAGGSLGYGQNFSVTEKSDIDLVMVCSKENACRLVHMPLFYQGYDGAQLFITRAINMFWVTNIIRDVKVNCFVYSLDDFENIGILKSPVKGFTHEKPKEQQEAYTFDGSKVVFDRNVHAFRNGFLYEKPIFVNGKFWGGPPKSDFIMGYHPLHQKDRFLDNLKEKVWFATLEQLMREHGPNPDLTSVNILNTDFTYQTRKNNLPPEAMQKVQEETKQRIAMLHALQQYDNKV